MNLRQIDTNRLYANAVRQNPELAQAAQGIVQRFDELVRDWNAHGIHFNRGYPLKHVLDVGMCIGAVEGQSSVLTGPFHHVAAGELSTIVEEAAVLMSQLGIKNPGRYKIKAVFDKRY